MEINARPSTRSRETSVLAPELETQTLLSNDLLYAQQAVLEMIIQGSALSQTLAALCRIVESNAADSVRAAIMLTDHGVQHLYTIAAPSLPQSYVRAVDGIAIAADVGTCSAAAARCCVIVTPDFAKDPGWVQWAQLPLAIGLRGAWSMPIIGSHGSVLGTFGTYFTEVREPTLAEQQLVAALTRIARLAIERHRADEALEARARLDRLLAELAAATQPLIEPAAILATTARLLAEHLQVDRCVYAEIEDEATLLIRGEHCRGVPSIVGRWPMAGFGEACTPCLQAGQAYAVNDAEQDVRVGAACLPTYRAMQAHAGIWVPLHKAGKLTAAMGVQQSQVRLWSEAEIELLGLVVGRCWESLERARVMRTLHESEAESRARVEYAVRLSGVGFWHCDLPFDELLWDERVKEHFFVAGEARITIDDFYARVHEADREPTRTAIETSIAERVHYDIIYRTVDPASGAVKWIHALGGATYDAAGSPVRFDGVTVEVTRQRQDQEHLARLLEGERAQVRLLERVAAIGIDMHASSTVERVLEVLTRCARELFEARAAHALFESRHAAASPIIVSDLLPGSAAPVSIEMVHTERSLRAPGELIVPFLQREGRQVGMVQLSGKQSGDFSAVDEALLVQLAQMAAVALENARLYEELRARDRRKDEFLATLAHELRNPLAPIRTGLEVLNLGSTGEQALKARQMMQRQVQHLVRIIDDLLDLSRVRLGKIALHPQPVEFKDILTSALETVQPLIIDNRHQLTVRLPSTPCVLRADVTRMIQVMGNLLTNAAKYTPVGGRIDVAAVAEQGTLVVRVSDSGVGIPREMLDKVFDLFTQVGHSLERSRGGLGLGLALVRKIVAMHGGTVEAESAGLDQGSTFIVRLPLG